MMGDFGELLRGFRRRTGWSQEALAERSGMSARTISVLESGRRPPRLSSAALLADALDLEAADRERLLATATGADSVAAPQAANQAGAVVEVLRQLPADLGTFTGRDAEVKKLLDSATAACAGARTVAISAIEGMGGVGKTRLAVRVAHELARSGRCADAQLYVSLRGFDPDQIPADPGDVLESLLRQLAVPPADIPSDTGGRAALFRHRMHGRDAVLILDDAADARQVQHLIPASPTCLVLITSRRTLTEIEGAAWHHLGVFSEQEALELLAPDRR
jgi:transcriptional regulator with XRE-family HTH domain